VIVRKVQFQEVCCLWLGSILLRLCECGQTETFLWQQRKTF